MSKGILVCGMSQSAPRPPVTLPTAAGLEMMATSEARRNAEAKRKRPAAAVIPTAMSPAKRLKGKPSCRINASHYSDGVSQVQRMSEVHMSPVRKRLTGAQTPHGGSSSLSSQLHLSQFEAIKKKLSSINEQVSVSTDLEWFGNSLVEKELIGAQPKDRILQSAGVSNTRKVGQLMQSVIVQIKNNPAKYGRFLAILRKEPVLTSLAESIKAEAKERSQLTEEQTRRRLSSGPEFGTSSAPKSTEVKRRLSLDLGLSALTSPTKARATIQSSQRMPTSSMTTPHSASGVASPIEPQGKCVVAQPQPSPMLGVTQPQAQVFSPQLISTASTGTRKQVWIDSSQGRTPSNTIASSWTESNKQTGALQQKVGTASTRPQEQVQKRTKQSFSTSSADGGKQVRFSIPQEKSGHLTSNMTTPKRNNPTCAVMTASPQPKRPTQGKPGTKPATLQPRIQAPLTQSSPASSFDVCQLIAVPIGFALQPQIHVLPHQSASACPVDDTRQAGNKSSPGKTKVTGNILTAVGSAELKGGTQVKEATEAATPQQQVQVDPRRSSSTSSVDCTPRVGSVTAPIHCPSTDALHGQNTLSGQKAASIKGAQLCQERVTALKEKLECPSEVNHDSTQLHVQAKQNQEQVLSKEKEFRGQAAASSAKQLQRQLQHQKQESTEKDPTQKVTQQFREQGATSKAKEGQLQKQLQEQEQASREKEDEYKTRLRDLSNKCSKLEAEAKTVRDRNAHLQAQVQLSSEQLVETQRRLQSKRQELTQQAATWKPIQQQFQQKVRDLQHSINAKEEECRRYREQERVSKEKKDQELKSHSSECATLKNTVAKLEQQLKQKDNQLQSVVTLYTALQSQTQQQLQSKVQEVASAQAKEQQLVKEIEGLRQSVVKGEKDLQQLQTQGQAFQAKELDYQQKMSSLSQQHSAAKTKVAQLQQALDQMQVQAQVTQKQVERRDQVIATVLQQLKELQEAEKGEVSRATQPSFDIAVAGSEAQ